jgi:hypothetical protein
MWPFKKKKNTSNIIKAEEVQPKDMNIIMILNLEAKHFLKVNGNESIDMLKPFLKLTSKQLNKGII